MKAGKHSDTARFVCTKCEKRKPFTAFRWNEGKQRASSWCRDCLAAYRKERRAARKAAGGAPTGIAKKIAAKKAAAAPAKKAAAKKTTPAKKTTAKKAAPAKRVSGHLRTSDGQRHPVTVTRKATTAAA